MIYLLQILKMLKPSQKELFVQLFSDLDYEINELGWKDDETTLVNDMLFNHFGLSIEDEFQLKRLTDSILKKGNVKAAYNIVKMK